MDALTKILEASEDSAETFLVADCDLKIIYISSAARRELGGTVGTFLTDHTSVSDSYRLEGFADDKNREISAMGISLSHLGKFRFGYVFRENVFTSPAIRVCLYPSRKDYLLSQRVQNSQFGFAAEPALLLDEIDKARSLFDSPYSPDKAKEAAASIDRLYRKVASDLLMRSVTSDSTYNSVFDLCAAVEMAMQNIADRRGGIDFIDSCSFSPALLANKCSPVRITAENLICLITAAYCSVDKSSRKPPSVSADLGESGELLIGITAECPSVCDMLPDGAGLIELDGLIKGQSFRIFLCDFICTKFGYNVCVTKDGGRLTLGFTVPPVREIAEFKSRDMFSISPVHLRLCADAIVGDLSNPEQDRQRQDEISRILLT